MASRDDIERIAAAVNAVRSDWQVRSLVTYLTQHHGARPFRVLLVAALVVATDERTQTPKLLEQQGPWWAAGQAAVGGFADVRFERCDKPGHSSYPASNCGACRSERIEDPNPRPVVLVDASQAATNTAGARRAMAALGRREGEETR